MKIKLISDLRWIRMIAPIARLSWTENNYRRLIFQW